MRDKRDERVLSRDRTWRGVRKGEEVRNGNDVDDDEVEEGANTGSEGLHVTSLVDNESQYSGCELS